MEKANCICRKNSLFKPLIFYTNETVFKAYEGICIKKCMYCGVLKTFPEKLVCNPFISKIDAYENNILEFETLFKPIVDKITQFIKGSRILDVGCSSGILLSQLKKQGFYVTGIEPNKKACALARKKLQSSIFCGTLQQFITRGGKKYYDCIIYNHVLEHIKDINGEIKLAKSLLRKDGLLVVGVPNIYNSIFYIRKKYWESLLPKEHIWHFSSRSLIEFLLNNGFHILNVSFTDDKRKTYPFVKQVYFGFLSFINQLFHTGEAVLIVAQKN